MGKPVEIIGSTDLENWRGQQITGILVILCFGIVAISYIIFANTYLFRKDKDSLKDSVIWFKMPMAGLMFISSIVIYAIMSNSNSNLTSIITTILVIANAVILLQIFQKSSSVASKYTDCINAFLGYGERSTENPCPFTFLTLLGEPLASYIFPLLFAIFVGVSFNSQSSMNNRILYAIFSLILFAEYIYKKRWNALVSIKNFIYNRVNSLASK